ncbi:MAG TPA: hypothetical protein VNS58_13305 [Puia sp.]|nr:hypothetical protein [Puia sp.]
MKKYIPIAFLFLGHQLCTAQPRTAELKVDWGAKVMTSRSTPTLQVVSNPQLRRGAFMHDGSFNALRDLKADYVRYVPWFPYPKLAVAELDAPDGQKTSWDFSLIDPMTIDFFEATKGHSVVMNFSTIPQWMFRTEQRVPYPADPNEVGWGYGGGTGLRDTTLQELAGYYSRLVSWYTKGGFTDELGKFHKSGYSYPIPYWEVLNEPDLEHNMTPQLYTRIYDAVVTAIRKVSPNTKFVGLGLAFERHPEYFEYFLNPANHAPGIPIDLISYHCYAAGNPDQKLEDYQYTLFDKADHFVNVVAYIESIRKRLSPATRTTINELGTFVNDEMRDKPIPREYWNLSASVYAYFFIELTKLGIDVIGESQLVGFRTQFPDVSMINPDNSKPNARFWVLQLIHDNFRAGDVLVSTGVEGLRGGDILAQGFKSGEAGGAGGAKKILMLNKRNKTIRIKLPAGFKGAAVSTVDMSSPSGDNAPYQSTLDSDTIEMSPFAVSVITLKTVN